MMERLARAVMAHRKRVIFAWLALTIFGAFAAKQVSTRWLEQFSIPGYSAYETNQKTLKMFGTGEQAPQIAVLTASGDVTRVPGVKQALAKVAAEWSLYRTSSYFTTGSDAYVSKDRHTTFATLYPPGNAGFSSNTHVKDIRKSLQAAVPPGVQASLTGRDALYESQGGSNSGPSIITEALIGGLGALIILLFV